MELFQKMKLFHVLCLMMHVLIPFSHVEGKGKASTRDVILKAKAKDVQSNHGLTMSCTFEYHSDKDVNLIMHPDSFELLIHPRGEKIKSFVLPRILISKKDIIHVGSGDQYTFDFEVSKDRYVWPEPIVHEISVVYHNSRNKIEDIRLWVGRIESNKLKTHF